MENNEFTLENANQFSGYYTESKFKSKLMKTMKRLSATAVYDILLLWYVLKSPDTPIRDKAVIIGAFGYFILPVDLIPDGIPVLGLTDDLAAIRLALSAVWNNVTASTRPMPWPNLGTGSAMSSLFRSNRCWGGWPQ